MTVAITENHEKTARAVPITIRCHWNPDAALVLRCQEASPPEQRLWKGEPIGSMSELWPWSDLKRQALSEAKTFAYHMRHQKGEYELIGEPSSMFLYGPYMEKVDWGRAKEVLEHDGYQHHPGFLYGVDDPPEFSKGVAFFIVGHFLARYGSLTTDGRTLVV